MTLPLSLMKMSSSFKLLGPAWTRTFRCIWMFEELGVPFELLEKALPRSKLVRQYMRTGKVPVLLEYDDGYNGGSAENDATPPFVLTESVAINTYLADKFAVPNGDTEREPFAMARFPSSGTDRDDDGESTLFMPRVGTRERAQYNELVSGILTELDASLWVHRRHTALGEHFGRIPQITAPSQVNFYRVNAVLAPRCNPYLLGTHFTPADILYAHCLDWAISMNWQHAGENEPLLQEWKVGGWPPNLDEYLRLCHSRPAYQRAKKLQDANPSPLAAKM